MFRNYLLTNCLRVKEMHHYNHYFLSSLIVNLLSSLEMRNFFLKIQNCFLLFYVMTLKPNTPLSKVDFNSCLSSILSVDQTKAFLSDFQSHFSTVLWFSPGWAVWQQLSLITELGSALVADCMTQLSQTVSHIRY